MNSNLPIIFTTAPAGFGHIRVMDTLKEGLPDSAITEEVGIENVQAGKIHALGSRVPFFQKVTEFYQTNSAAEKIISSLYGYNVRLQASDTIEKLTEIFHRHPNNNSFVIVSTHFGLATSIVAAKPTLKRMGNKVYVFVVMTDDSSQRVWAVKGADVVFCPSDATTSRIKSYLKGSSTKVVTVPFPISPRLTVLLDADSQQQLEHQLSPTSRTPLGISIPISGAAVQLDTLLPIIRGLAGSGFAAFVVGNESPYTHLFFDQINKLPNTQVLVGKDARQTVSFYESLFNQKFRPAVEITKPSEQAFKALIAPRQRGGVILLLTSPIGRQERDNLAFLKRHDLLPDDKLGQQLIQSLLAKGTFTKDEQAYWFYCASHWRALILPQHPAEAVKFIKALHDSGLLLAMLSYAPSKVADLRTDGVEQIWKEISVFVE